MANEPSLLELKRRCEKDPQEVGNVIDLVRRYSSLGKHGEALKLCRSMIKRHSRAYSFLLEFANVLYRNDDIKEARLIFKRLTELKPDRVEAWNNLGILELSAGNLEEAHEVFDCVLKLEPRNVGALCNIGNYFADKGDEALAATYFERAVDIRPDFTEAWYNLGNSYMSLNRFSDAKDALEKAVFYEESFGSAHKNLGFACEQLGEYDKALSCYGKAAALNKDDAGVHVNMAGVHMRMEMYGKALECGKRAVRLAPAEPSGWNALRSAALQLNDGRAYHRAVIAFIGSIDDDSLARSIRDLRKMGFEREAEELQQYAVKINKAGVSVDALPFAESRAPTLQAEAINQQLYKIINNRSAVGRG
ncbi:MAG: tetratricopeptide repeat protein [Chitinispirillales bacterium]|jgi:tetratricopeptide (TPR) repeat protein|nr:tetratricopeptide repeat protein [Chitinispirillales bacterium]